MAALLLTAVMPCALAQALTLTQQSLSMLTPAAVPQPLSEAERQVLADSRQQANVMWHRKAWDESQALLEATRALAQRHWGMATWRWLQGLRDCALNRPDRPMPVSRAEIDAFYRPAITFADAAPADDPQEGLLAARLWADYWHAVRQLGQSAEGDAMEHGWVQPRLDAVFGPADASLAPSAGRQARVMATDLALRELWFWAQHFYGAREMTGQMRRWQALLAQRLGEAHPLTLALRRDLAFNQRQLGRPREALAYADEASQLAAQYHPADERLQMQVASDRAASLVGMGRLVEARDETLRLRDGLLREQPPNHGNLMRSLYNLAALSIELGDLDAAITYAEASQWHAEQSGWFGDLQEARVARMWRAEARLLRGDAGAAADLQAALHEAQPTEPATGSSAYTLAKQSARRGSGPQLRWAADFLARYADANLDPISPDRALLPLVQAWIAELPSDGTAPVAASATHNPALRLNLARALTLSLSERAQGVQSQTHFALARLEAPRQPALALWLYKRGANALQRLRAQLGVADESLHRAWLADHEADLRAFIGLLIDQGRLLEAQQAIALLRSEELHEYTRRSRRGAGLVAPLPLPYTPAEAARNASLQPLADAMQAATAAADQRADARQNWTERTRAVDAEVEALLADGAQRVLRLLDTAAAAAAPGLARNAAVPPAGVARLHTFVRDNGLDLVLQDAHGIARRHVAISAVMLHREIHALRSAVATPGGDALVPAQRLHRWLIAPLAQRLAGVRRLQIDADGALRQLPFAALHDGRHYLAERLELVQLLAPPPTLDAAGAIAQTGSRRRGLAAGFLLAAGRTLPDVEHAALPGVAEELATLRRLRARPVSTLQDGGFTRQALREALQRHPAVVHLASHFVLDPAGEDSSYLLLGDGSRLAMSQIGSLPWQGVRLALLSACDSGLALPGGGAATGQDMRGGAAVAGAPDPALPVRLQGGQLAGFASALQRAGVSEVLATLWPISDGVTAKWMGEFYAPWQRPGTAALPNAGWLARTQRGWLRRHAGTALAHPHYWAAFVWLAP